ncbi:multicopper oxidase domain-containing protein [Hazenella sp. IB182357]|uniref:Copper-containing nitrite reductase n=2 Tax=Polycladospora coralii TaxID=2771432 RepID=A0A926N8Q3_9BACL|nr:multicopper oxidase domain-containing protein [Polycladospora coralii]MBS7529205.1 multicopper oxidase domain-containing protein [Polycladospora coralii]
MGATAATLLPKWFGQTSQANAIDHSKMKHSAHMMTKQASAHAYQVAEDVLYNFDYGKVSKLPDGRTLREYEMFAQEKEVEIAGGVYYPAWTYNGRVPGPTIRATEGDLLRIHFTNGATHPHTIHFHGKHPGNMDGVYEIINPGESFTYEFTAEPFGLHLYHCHVMPLKKHIEKGMYGAFIIDPKEPREKMTEMVMVMNAFDTDFDGENEFYTVNGLANAYMDRPIQLKVGEKVRVYCVNVTEFDLINSFHLHGDVFKLYRTGTSLTQYEITDTVTMCQGERAILEFKFDFPGKYMFHAHQSEFAELGWMGVFEVKE